MAVDYSKPQLTALQITMMLHYYAVGEPYSLHHPEHARSPAVHNQRQALIVLGALRRDDSYPSGFAVTERGVTYVKRLTHTPLPLQVHAWSYED